MNTSRLRFYDASSGGMAKRAYYDVNRPTGLSVGISNFTHLAFIVFTILLLTYLIYAALDSKYPFKTRYFEARPALEKNAIDSGEEFDFTTAKIEGFPLTGVVTSSYSASHPPVRTKTQEDFISFVPQVAAYPENEDGFVGIAYNDKNVGTPPFGISSNTFDEVKSTFTKLITGYSGKTGAVAISNGGIAAGVVHISDIDNTPSDSVSVYNFITDKEIIVKSNWSKHIVSISLVSYRTNEVYLTILHDDFVLEFFLLNFTTCITSHVSVSGGANAYTIVNTQFKSGTLISVGSGCYTDITGAPTYHCVVNSLGMVLVVKFVTTGGALMLGGPSSEHLFTKINKNAKIIKLGVDATTNIPTAVAGNMVYHIKDPFSQTSYNIKYIDIAISENNSIITGLTSSRIDVWNNDAPLFSNYSINLSESSTKPIAIAVDDSKNVIVTYPDRGTKFELYNTTERVSVSDSKNLSSRPPNSASYGYSLINLNTGYRTQTVWTPGPVGYVTADGTRGQTKLDVLLPYLSNHFHIIDPYRLEFYIAEPDIADLDHIYGIRDIGFINLKSEDLTTLIDGHGLAFVVVVNPLGTKRTEYTRESL